MVGAKRIFVVIKSLRFFNSMRRVSQRENEDVRIRRRRRGERLEGGGDAGGERRGAREGRRRAKDKPAGYTPGWWEEGTRRNAGQRREKRRHDDRAINNIGEKGDRLQHSAQMLNRYQFNGAQSARSWAAPFSRGLAKLAVVGDAAQPSTARVAAVPW